MSDKGSAGYETAAVSVRTRSRGPGNAVTSTSAARGGSQDRFVGHRHLPRHWRDIHPSRRGPVLAWLAFTVTFLIARLVTGAIKIFGKDSGNVNAGTLHLHHFLWGILLVVGVACYGLFDRSDKAHTRMGVILGIGLALIVDEVALLVTLRDVYWQSSGWTSVGAAVALIGIGGTVLVASGSHRCTVDPHDPSCRHRKRAAQEQR